MTAGQYMRLGHSCAPPRKWTVETVIEAIRRAKNEDGTVTATAAGATVVTMAGRLFGSWSVACEMAGAKPWLAAQPRYAACSVDGCDRPPRSSLSPHCETHYYRLRRTGSILRKDGRAERQTFAGCQYCGSDSRGNRFCCQRCAARHEYGLPQTINCTACGCEFSPLERNQVCSDECDRSRSNLQSSAWRRRNIERERQRSRAAEYRRKARKAAVACEDIDRRAIFERDGWLCQLCGLPVNAQAKWPEPDFATLDHVVPLAAGGPHVAQNVQCAHLVCNLSKGARSAPLSTLASRGLRTQTP